MVKGVCRTKRAQVLDLHSYILVEKAHDACDGILLVIIIKVRNEQQATGLCPGRERDIDK